MTSDCTGRLPGISVQALHHGRLIAQHLHRGGVVSLVYNTVHPEARSLLVNEDQTYTNIHILNFLLISSFCAGKPREQSAKGQLDGPHNS